MLLRQTALKKRHDFCRDGMERRENDPLKIMFESTGFIATASAKTRRRDR